jgi:hypothetical protein
MDPLVDARQERLLNQPTNQLKRELIQRLLTALYQQVLRRDFYGVVTLRFTVHGGIIHHKPETCIEQQHGDE